MTNADFTITIAVDQSAHEAYDAINRPRDWWGKEIEGATDRLGAQWTYRYKDIHYSKHETTELVPERRVVWSVVDSKLSFLKDQAEWVGTRIVFDIDRKDDKTEIRFTHAGLVPDVECFDICVDAWSGLIKNSLRKLIATGEGLPDSLE